MGIGVKGLVKLCVDLTNAIYGKANKHGYWVMNWKMLNVYLSSDDS